MAKASAKNEIGRRSIGLVEGKISTGNRCSYMFLPSRKMGVPVKMSLTLW